MDPFQKKQKKVGSGHITPPQADPRHQTPESPKQDPQRTGKKRQRDETTSNSANTLPEPSQKKQRATQKSTSPASSQTITLDQAAIRERKKAALFQDLLCIICGTHPDAQLTFPELLQNYQQYLPHFKPYCKHPDNFEKQLKQHLQSPPPIQSSSQDFQQDTEISPTTASGKEFDAQFNHFKRFCCHEKTFTHFKQVLDTFEQSCFHDEFGYAPELIALINTDDSAKGWTLLHYACFNLQEKIVKFLLTKQASTSLLPQTLPFHPDKRECSAYHLIASFFGSRARTPESMPLEHYAALNIVDQLWEKGVADKLINDGESALHILAKYCDSYQLTKKLIEGPSKAFLKQQNQQNWTPADVALMRQNFRVLTALLEHKDVLVRNSWLPLYLSLKFDDTQNTIYFMTDSEYAAIDIMLQHKNIDANCEIATDERLLDRVWQAEVNMEVFNKVINQPPYGQSKLAKLLIQHGATSKKPREHYMKKAWEKKQADNKKKPGAQQLPPPPTQPTQQHVQFAFTKAEQRRQSVYKLLHLQHLTTTHQSLLENLPEELTIPPTEAGLAEMCRKLMQQQSPHVPLIRKLLSLTTKLAVVKPREYAVKKAYKKHLPFYHSTNAAEQERCILINNLPYYTHINQQDETTPNHLQTFGFASRQEAFQAVNQLIHHLEHPDTTSTLFKQRIQTILYDAIHDNFLASIQRFPDSQTSNIPFVLHEDESAVSETVEEVEGEEDSDDEVVAPPPVINNFTQRFRGVHHQWHRRHSHRNAKATLKNLCLNPAVQVAYLKGLAQSTYFDLYLAQACQLDPSGNFRQTFYEFAENESIPGSLTPLFDTQQNAQFTKDCLAGHAICLLVSQQEDQSVQYQRIALNREKHFNYPKPPTKTYQPQPPSSLDDEINSVLKDVQKGDDPFTGPMEVPIPLPPPPNVNQPPPTHIRITDTPPSGFSNESLSILHTRLITLIKKTPPSSQDYALHGNPAECQELFLNIQQPNHIASFPNFRSNLELLRGLYQSLPPSPTRYQAALQSLAEIIGNIDNFQKLLHLANLECFQKQQKLALDLILADILTRPVAATEPNTKRLFINQPDANQCSLLFLAAQHTKVELMGALAKHGAAIAPLYPPYGNILHVLVKHLYQKPDRISLNNSASKLHNVIAWFIAVQQIPHDAPDPAGKTLIEIVRELDKKAFSNQSGTYHPSKFKQSLEKIYRILDQKNQTRPANHNLVPPPPLNTQKFSVQPERKNTGKRKKNSFQQPLRAIWQLRKKKTTLPSPTPKTSNTPPPPPAP